MTLRMFTWTEELSVGVRELDEQHQHLFQMVNEIIAMTEKKTPPSIESIIHLVDGIINYGFYHLSVEEEYMSQFGCPNPDHIESHRLFKLNLQQQYENGRDALKSGSETAMAMIREFAIHTGDWHMGHIPHMDKTYTVCFNDHGLH